MKLILDPEFWKSRLTIRTLVGAFMLEAMDKMDRKLLSRANRINISHSAVFPNARTKHKLEQSSNSKDLNLKILTGYKQM